MSVRYGFTVEIYGFRHSLHTCLAHDAHEGQQRWTSGQNMIMMIFTKKKTADIATYEKVHWYLITL